MKAKTIRPLLLLLLFGFFPTSGWMIVRSGPDTTGVPGASSALPADVSARPHAGVPGPAIPTPPGASGSSTAAAYGPPSASNTPGAEPPAASGATVRSPALAAPAEAIDSSGDPVGGSGEYAFSSSDGFGDFGVPDTLPGGSASALGGPYSPVPGGSLPSTHSGSDSGGSGTRGGSGGSGTPGGTGGTGGPGNSGGSSGNGSGSLLDPPGATGGTGGSGSSGSNPISGSNTHQATVHEPSTLALFLAGTAALGFALRRRLRI